MKDLDISEVAKRTGVPASTLRYYEEKGLIHAIGRRGLRRLFDPSVLDWLNLIALGKASGFRLSDIQQMFGKDGPHIDRDTLMKKAVEIEGQIRQLQAMREGLLHAAKCPAESHLECETFRKLMRLAGKQQLRSKAAP